MIVGTRSGDIYFVSIETPPEFIGKDVDIRDNMNLV